MNTEQKIRAACGYVGISMSELARKIGQSPQNLRQKIKRDSLTPEEMEQIASALGGTWHAEFRFPDGTVIGN